MKAGATRLILSPSVEVDEVWHEHMRRPVLYFQMCKLLIWRNETSDFTLCLIDHTPNSEEDAEDVKEVRRQRTRDYMDLICPNWEKAFGAAVLREDYSMSDLTAESDEGTDDKEVKRQRLSDILHSVTSYFKKNTIFPTVKVTLLVYDSDPDLQLSLDLSIYPSEPVQTVKERISTFHNIPPVTEQILIYKERILVGNSSDWEIEENDSLHLFMPTISVTIKPLGSRDTLAIRANPSMSVYC
jgi:hypothetical protein